MRHVLLGTAGHVDHGKTTLIRALTGVDTDRLAEEQARGMTIDLGFASLELPGGIHAGIVDVPGHERFVKNMLAGAGGVDVALVVVAADEGPMPQTREHLDILTVLGVSCGVVALTKCDLADPELRALAADETRAALASTSLKEAPIVPVCALTGAGLEELKTALAEAARQAPARKADGPVRLPVDRVFSLPGVGTVVTGTLAAGTLRAGEPVAVQPQGLASRARTLQTHNRKVEEATPGMRVAVNLPGVDVGEMERGAVLCTPGSLAPTFLFDTRLQLLPSAARPLAHRERVRLHLGAGELLARVYLLDRDRIEPGETEAPAQLRCESPAAPARGETFVLRTYSPARAVGGGIVLEPAPARRYRRSDPKALALFAARGSGRAQEKVEAALCARHADFSPAEIAAATGLDSSETIVHLEALVDMRRAFVLTDGRYLAEGTADRLRETARRALAAYHRQNPLRRAMPRDGLRAPLAKAATLRDFGALLTFLVQQGVCLGEGAGGVRLPAHEVVLPPGWQQAAEAILAVYRGARFLPPPPASFQTGYPRDVNVLVIHNILAENGQLVRIADDLYLDAETIAEAKEILRRLAETPHGISVATVRDATGSSRKVILPLLEYFDGVRFTRRVGDNRVLVE